MRCEVVLPADERAPLLARSSLNELIPPPELLDRADDARLAVSELATDAVRYGRLRPDQDTVRLVVEADDDHVRVEMEQATDALDVRVVEPRLDDPNRVGGYGSARRADGGRLGTRARPPRPCLVPVPPLALSRATHRIGWPEASTAAGWVSMCSSPASSERVGDG